MDPMMTTMLSNAGEIVPVLAVGGGLFVAIVAIITSAIRQVAKTKAREQTKREIAAYVAEGSMTPEDGERLIRADRPTRPGVEE